MSNATGGTVALNDDGTVTFTPDADLCGDGAAGFDYTVEDGNGGSDTGHVTVDLDLRQRRALRRQRRRDHRPGLRPGRP